MTNTRNVKEALTASTNVKEKGPPVSDGVLSITPDPPEVLEWRKANPVVGTVSSSYLDDDEGQCTIRCSLRDQTRLPGITCSHDDAVPHKPYELFGKFTWKIENFSEISKRELRSAVFDVGSYKWCVSLHVHNPQVYYPGQMAPTALCAQVHPRVPPGLRCLQPPVAVPLRGGLRQAAARCCSL